MGRWAQANKRGGVRERVDQVSGPLLTFAAEDEELAWQWNQADPVFWRIESSLVFIGPYAVISTIAGSLRDDSGYPIGLFYRVSGWSGAAVTTPLSNVVGPS